MGIFSFCFNTVSKDGYHSHALLLKKNGLSEKIYHFAAIAHTADKFIVHELVSGVAGKALSHPLPLNDAMTRVNQLFSLREQSLRTAAHGEDIVEILHDHMPTLDGIAWRPFSAVQHGVAA